MFDDIDYNAVFGLDSDAENAPGEEEQETAEPAEEEDTEGEEEQEAAEPAENSGESPDDTGAEEQDSSGEKKPKGKKDSVYAAARRRAEAEADAKAEAKATAMLNEMISGYNWTDPYTGQQIKTKAEYESYLEKFNEDQRKKVQEKSGMNDEQYEKYVAGLPEVREARKIKEEAQQAQIRQQIADELKQISALDPSIHTVSDVLSGENGELIRECIAKGMTMLDAFKLANFDRLRNGAAEDERRHAGYNAASKAHLTQSKSRGQGMTMVPKDTLDMYRAFNPDMTDAEIQKDYNKYLNGG